MRVDTKEERALLTKLLVGTTRGDAIKTPNHLLLVVKDVSIVTRKEWKKLYTQHGQVQYKRKQDWTLFICLLVTRRTILSQQEMICLARWNQGPQQKHLCLLLLNFYRKMWYVVMAVSNTWQLIANQKTRNMWLNSQNNIVSREFKCQCIILKQMEQQKENTIQSQRHLLV